MQALRRFKHKEGFGDKSQFVECRPDGTVWILSRTGRYAIAPSSLTLQTCTKMVKKGSWLEIGADTRPLVERLCRAACVSLGVDPDAPQTTFTGEETNASPEWKLFEARIKAELKEGA